MAKMSIALAQKIIKDSRYSASKKKLARSLLKEAGMTTKKSLKKRKLIKKSTKTKGKSKTKTITGSKSKRTKTRKSKVSKTRTKTTSKAQSRSNSGPKIKFYDVANKKHVMIPRDDCRLKKNKNARGGDQLIADYKGRTLFTFVKKGFEL